MRYQVVREGGLFVIRMTPAEFAEFAFEQLKKSEAGEDNGETGKAKRGRPPRDSQQPLVEQDG